MGRMLCFPADAGGGGVLCLLQKPLSGRNRTMAARPSSFQTIWSPCRFHRQISRVIRTVTSDGHIFFVVAVVVSPMFSLTVEQRCLVSSTVDVICPDLSLARAVTTTNRCTGAPVSQCIQTVDLDNVFYSNQSRDKDSTTRNIVPWSICSNGYSTYSC